MQINLIIKSLTTLIFLIIFTACSGGGGGGSSLGGNSISTKYAVLFDSIVIGAKYDAGSGITGYTDANGMFRYVEGQNIKFYIGDVFIGEGQPVDKPTGVSAVTDKIITPLGLTGAGDDIDNFRTLKIVRFLMAMDRDNNATNGIDIDIDRVSGHDLSLLDANIILHDTFGNLTLPSSSGAREHFCQSLGRNDCNQVPMEDTTKPTITLLGSTTVNLTQGITYTDLGATAEDNRDGDITANIIVNNPVGVNTIGDYTVTYDVNDSANNQANQVSRIVSVVLAPDTTPPTKPTLTTTPTTTTNNTQSIEINGEVEATVWIDGVQKGTIGADGKLTISLDTSGADGVKNFSIVLKDSNSNSSEVLVVNIEKTTALIPDTTKPIITLNTDVNISINIGETYIELATASDDRDGDITANIVITNEVNSSMAGVYILKYDLNDTAGNEADTLTRTVRVVLAESTKYDLPESQGTCSNTTFTTQRVTAVEENKLALTNAQYDNALTTMSYCPEHVAEYGSAFELKYVDQVGVSGFQGYPNGLVGGYKDGSWHPGDKRLSGMPVLLGDLSNDMVIQWKISHENALDEGENDSDKWMASINMIFDEGDANAKPDADERFYDLVIELESHLFKNDLNDTNLTLDPNPAKRSYLARNDDGSLRTFDLMVDGQIYKYGVRYKFFRKGTSVAKDKKVHVKYIPIDEENIPPYLNHSAKAFIDNSKDFIQYARMPEVYRTIANENTAKPTLYLKSIRAGYEVYRGECTLRNDYFRIMNPVVPNTAPTITGTPKTTTNVYGTYQFMPIATDANGDALTFSIQNKPIWATFDVTTGLLKGIPSVGSEGSNSNVIISVSDGSETISLAPFAIEVGSALNLAHLYGKATQGSIWGSYPASNAIDDNLNTMNHTGCSNPDNWWQVELLSGTKIKKIVVHNRSGQENRLNGTKIYLGSQTHDGTLMEANHIETLTDAVSAQEFIYDIAKEGNFLLLKSNGTCLHTPEVEVYGELPDKPYFDKEHYTLGLEPNSVIGSVVGSVEAKDFQNDPLTYSIVGTVPFEIDSSSGLVKLTQLIDHNANQFYTFTVNTSDGTSSSSCRVTVNLLSTTGVTLEKWIGISGGYVSNLTDSDDYKNDPADEIRVISQLDDYQATGGNNYGQRLTAILKPTQSANYIFNLVGDKRAELWLSNDSNSSNLEKIVATTWHSGSHKDWSDTHAKQSQAVYLKANGIYAIQVLHKDGGNPNFVSVGWKKVADTDYALIPSNQLFLETLNAQNVKPIFETHVADFTIQSANAIGDNVLSTRANDSQGDSLTYTIIGDVPFVVDGNGQITINDSLEIKTYSFDIDVSDGTHTTRTHVNVTSTANTAGLNDAKEDFYTKARAFTSTSSVDELVTSYLAYAHVKAQFTYDEFMPESADADIWTYIENNPTIKEGLYASRFPANPYFVKNLADFKSKWEEEGKSEAFIAQYKNVALGLSINAREAGIFKEVSGGDTSEHPTIDYSKLAHYEAQEQRWREHFDFANLGYGISANNLKKYMQIKYSLSASETDSIWHSRTALKNIVNDIGNIGSVAYADRVTHGLSFDGLNVYRLSSGLSREDCDLADNPCPRIEAFITAQGITKTQFLGDFKNYKGQVTGLINPLDKMAYSLRGELGVIPKDKNDYRLMSFYDLANWKITNDEIAAIDFNDNEPNWPIFQSTLSTLSWQLLALTQSAQKQECEYVKSRFFETDKAELIASYPSNAVDGGAGKERRFKEYTSYTWAYNEPEVWYRQSDWSPSRTVYRVLQDGGVCGRQSTMGQHVNECLNRPSIGVGQPGHRAWVGVYNSSANPEQYQTNIGYQVGSRESATANSKLIYNQYTREIRRAGMERITGVATGVSPASAGEQGYNQSMIFQHIGKLLEEDGTSAESVLKKSVDLVPNNVDAWYQLALYYASLDQPEKVMALAKEFMDNRDNFFVDLDSRKGAENMEVVTAKNIAFIALKAPSIADGTGDRAEWGETQLWSYLDTYEAENRSLRSYRNQNRYLAKRYLEKEQDEAGFASAVEMLFSRFLSEGSSGTYHSDYFRGVEFRDSNKTELFDTLQDLTDQAQISEGRRGKIYSDILGRNNSVSLGAVTVNDVCLDNNLSKCQSIKSFNLYAKSIYITVDNRVGEDTEVDPTKRGISGYSMLTVPAVDDLGKDMDIKIRIAKIATADGINGKVLKINDPSEVATDVTKVVAWIDPTDNTFEEGRLYTAGQRIILKVKKRVQNNEEFMGNMILNLKDLIKGHGLTFNGETFTQKYIDDSTSIYFTTLDSTVGPTSGNWFGSGYTTLSIKIKDENGVEAVLKLRANNNSRQMNAGQNADWDNILKIAYDSADNTGLVSGTRYRTITPFVIDARMWHKGSKVKDRMYVGVDFVVP